MRLLLAPGRPAALLALSDALAILVFVTVGLLSHDGAVSLGGYAADALPLLAGWFGAALACGTYRRRTLGSLLAAWIVGVPAGVLIRALALGHPLDGDQLAFLIVSLVFSLTFLAALRVVLGGALALRARVPT